MTFVDRVLSLNKQAKYVLSVKFLFAKNVLQLQNYNAKHAIMDLAGIQQQNYVIFRPYVKEQHFSMVQYALAQKDSIQSWNNLVYLAQRIV